MGGPSATVFCGLISNFKLVQVPINLIQVFKMRKSSTRRGTHANSSDGTEGVIEKGKGSDHLMSDLSGRGEGLSGGGDMERMGGGGSQVENVVGGWVEADKQDNELRFSLNFFRWPDIFKF